MPVFRSTKTYTHSVGLSACFRQWRADSHCKYLHGYALKIEMEFGASELDARNWVVDFGSLKSLKGWIEGTLDHKTLVAKDDPEYQTFKNLHTLGIIDMVEVEATGCERIAEFIFGAVDVWLQSNGYAPRCYIRKVQVWEHEGNSAIYELTPLEEHLKQSAGDTQTRPA